MESKIRIALETPSTHNLYIDIITVHSIVIQIQKCAGHIDKITA